MKVCTHALIDGEKVRLNDKVKEKILTENKKMADKALRVLCAATKEYGKNPPKSYDAGYLEKGLCYVGLCGMIDPVREMCIRDRVRVISEIFWKITKL